MSEAGLWAVLRKGMAPHWQAADRHEDKLQRGVADVSFAIAGHHHWMELKKVDAWPKLEATPLRIRHYTDEQRYWLTRKGKAGGNTWLFVQVARDYLLFDWRAAPLVGNIPRAELLGRCCGVWSPRVDWEAMAAVLAEGC